MARRAARIDANQNEIVKELRALGYSVAITSMCGMGFPDIVVGGYSANFLFEIKDGTKSPSQQKLTEAEDKFKSKWLGQYNIITTSDQAVQIMNNSIFNR